MDRVLDRLWIGSSEDFKAPFAALGFAGVLDLRDSGKEVAAGVQTYVVSNRDGDPWNKEQVRAALAFVLDCIQRGPVLIACAAGMSRSACMTIGYLVWTGWDVVEAYDHVKRARSKILPVPKMLDSVLAAVRT